MQDIIRNQNPYVNINPYPLYQYPYNPSNTPTSNLRKETRKIDNDDLPSKMSFKEIQPNTNTTTISKDLQNQIDEFKKIVAELNKTKSMQTQKIKETVNVPVENQQFHDIQQEKRQNQDSVTEVKFIIFIL